MADNDFTLDDLDWSIIRELGNDPRINITDLAEKLDKNRNTIKARLDRLDGKTSEGKREEGLITSSIIPNFKRLGGITGYILATSTPGMNQQEIAKKVVEKDGVEEVAVVTGEWDFIIKIYARSMEQIGDVIIQNLRKEVGIQKTITCISFWTYQGKNPFYYLLPNKNK
ncbi:MAG: Lrp/AsnC family transcriptional regulator [Candidatus Thorarchaeota archaeon]